MSSKRFDPEAHAIYQVGYARGLSDGRKERDR
jgi:hypothetical protein